MSSVVGSDGDAGRPREWRLTLLGTWQLTTNGRIVDVPAGGKRLIALLALRGRCSRSYAAGTLWPDCPEGKAQANLRATISRVRRHIQSLVVRTGPDLSLATAVVVDVVDLLRLSYQILDHRLPPEWPSLYRPHAHDLLAGWYDEWVLNEREHLRQLRLHALETLSGELLQAGNHSAAIEAALAAVAIEPLRESAHRAVIAVHLAEGNRAEAYRQAARLRSMLRSELDVEPSDDVVGLLRGSARG